MLTEHLMRVLVVDDHQDLVDSEAIMVQLWGHEVCVARDGLEALEAAGRQSPDVVLLDIDMPQLDGWEVARRIRKKETMKDILLVAVSGFGQEKDRLRSEEAGFNHHLLKPVNPSTL